MRRCGSEMRGEEHRRPSRWDSHTHTLSLSRALHSALCALSTGAERWGVSNYRLASLAGLVVLGLADSIVAACFIMLTLPCGPVESFSKSTRRSLFTPRERHRDNDALSSILPSLSAPSGIQEASIHWIHVGEPSQPQVITQGYHRATPQDLFASALREWKLKLLRESWAASISHKSYFAVAVAVSCDGGTAKPAVSAGLWLDEQLRLRKVKCKYCPNPDLSNPLMSSIDASTHNITIPIHLKPSFTHRGPNIHRKTSAIMRRQDASDYARLSLHQLESYGTCAQGPSCPATGHKT